MSPAVIAAILVTVLCTVGLVLAERKQSQRGVMIAKPLASLGFIAVAVLAGGSGSLYGGHVLWALGLCALGDVLLIPRGNGAPFLLGMGAFGLGHGAFTVAFARYGIDDTAMLVALAPMAVVAGLTLRWLGPRLPPLMQSAVRFYIAVISVMVSLAIGATVATGQWLITAGALLFAVSDLFVARERFVTQAFVNQAVGLPLYYGAQILLALSVIGAE